MATELIDRLLTTLEVDLHAFAVCVVAPQAKLVFDPMAVVVIHYVLDGGGVLEVPRAEPIPFGPGAILAVPPNRGQALVAGNPPHVAITAGEHCRMLSDGLIEFDASGGAVHLRTVCATLTATYGGSFGLFDRMAGPLAEDATAIAGMTAAFDLLIAERRVPGVGSRALTETVMKQCLILLIRSHFRRAGTWSPLLGQLADPRLAAVVEQVLREPAAPVSLDRLASRAGMSRSAFSAAFRSAFGQSPIDFVQRTRLHNAARLLACTELPIKAVAAASGFASRSHFSRAFRLAYDADPSAFRAARLNTGRDASGGDRSGGGRGWLTRVPKTSEH